MDDEKIVDLFWERSELAIVETKTKYGKYCRSIAFNILSNYSDVEECENDTYIAAWNAMPPTRPTKLLAFLGRLTRNIALDRYDYNFAQKRNGEFNLLLSELEECIPSTYNLEAQYENGQIAKAISKFLYTVDSQRRVIFIRRYWYSDSIKDISLQFGITDSKVKSILFRTRNKLKAYLEKEGIKI